MFRKVETNGGTKQTALLWLRVLYLITCRVNGFQAKRATGVPQTMQTTGGSD